MRLHIYSLLLAILPAAFVIDTLYMLHHAYAPSVEKADKRYMYGAAEAYQTCQPDLKGIPSGELYSKYSPEKTGMSYLETVISFAENCKTDAFKAELERLQIERQEYLKTVDKSNESFVKRAIQEILIVVVIVYTICYLIVRTIAWIRNRFFPNLSRYTEIDTAANGHEARFIRYKLNRAGIKVYVDYSDHPPMPCRILVPTASTTLVPWRIRAQQQTPGRCDAG